MNVSRISRIVLLVLALSLSACSFGLPNLGANTPPCSVTTSQQAAERLLQKIRTQSGKTGTTVSISATSDEVSSLILLALDQYKTNNPGNYIPLEHPVVCFQHEKMTLSGSVRFDQSNTLDALIAINPALTNGKAAFKIEQVQVGAFSVPQEFSTQIAALINNTLNQYLTQVTLTDITIQDGQMTLTGRVQ